MISLINVLQGGAGISPREIVALYQKPSGEVNFVALSKEGTQLSNLSRHLGTTVAAKHLSWLISDFASQFNTYQAMTPEQVADLAEELVVDWWNYTMEDFVVFFNRAKKESFRRIVEKTETYFENGEKKVKTKIVDEGPIRITSRVDRGIILEMLASYDRERVDAFFEHETKGHTMESKPLPEKYQPGPGKDFSFADVIKVIQGEATAEEIIQSKKQPEAVEDTTAADLEEAHRQAQIKDQQVKTFVAEVMKYPDPRIRYSQPFYKGNEEAIEAELKIQRKKLKDEAGQNTVKKDG